MRPSWLLTKLNFPARGLTDTDISMSLHLLVAETIKLKFVLFSKLFGLDYHFNIRYAFANFVNDFILAALIRQKGESQNGSFKKK